MIYIDRIYNLMISKYMVKQESEKSTSTYLVATVSEDNSLKIANLSLNLDKSAINCNLIK